MPNCHFCWPCNPKVNTEGVRAGLHAKQVKVQPRSYLPLSGISLDCYSLNPVLYSCSVTPYQDFCLTELGKSEYVTTKRKETQDKKR